MANNDKQIVLSLDIPKTAAQINKDIRYSFIESDNAEVAALSKYIFIFYRSRSNTTLVKYSLAHSGEHATLFQ